MKLSFLRNWPFALKFAIAPLFALLGIILMVSLAVSALSGSNATMGRVIENGLGASLEVGSIGRDFKTAEARLYRFMTAVASGEKTADASEMEAIAAEIGAVEQRLAALQETAIGESMADSLTLVSGELAKYREAIAVVGTMLEIDFASAASLLTPFGALGDRVSRTVEDMIASGANTARADAGVAQERASATLRNILIIAVIGTLVLAGASFAIGIETVSGTRTIAEATSKVAAGDASIDIDALGRRDELGAIATALRTFRETQQETDRLRADQEAAQKREAEQAEQRRREATDREASDRQREAERQQKAIEERRQLAANFDKTISNLMHTLDAQAKKVEESAKGMKARAGENASWSRELTEASSAVLENIQLISAAAEQMRASIDEISGQVQQSSSNVGQAVTATEETAVAVSSLSESVQQIGQIVALINDIADQTNLLALNATIEAARAGEAGKGFAVVASEVKSLAAQTAKATNDIGNRIGEVQQLTGSVVERIAATKALIGHAEESSAAIASAVEEQAAATQEIARTVNMAAQDTGRFSERVEKMNVAATQNGAASESLLMVTTELGKDFRTLEEAAQGFAREIRA